MSRFEERVENFNKSFQLFSEMRSAYIVDKSSNVNRLALVQSFEIVSELGWKVLKDYLGQNGINVYLPKEVIKEAFANNIIKNGQIWIDMINDRNSSSHEYNMEKVDIILVKIATIYFEELSSFQKLLGELHG
jgi:nucleotidyltransferase substrate binding protein (TIGR01987 family)